MGKKAVVYVRVSTPDQAEEELPIASQLERCKAKAALLGADVVRVFADEGRSGRYDNRPAFQNAITYCESSQVDYFVTWSTSRFVRNKWDAALYKKRLHAVGTKLVYVSQPIDTDTDAGWLTEGIFEIFDELYSRQTSADILRSMEKNARDGRWNGGCVPFGFKVIEDPQDPRRKKLAPNDADVAIVNRIFDMRLEGHGAKTIAHLLNSEKIHNRAAKWTKKSILTLLRNQTVIGNIVFGRRKNKLKQDRPREEWVVVKSHEAVVSVEKFEAVQELLGRADLVKEGSTSMRSNFVFTGMLKCGICGSAMTTESAKGRNRRYYYYNCQGSIARASCAPRRLPASSIDEWLTDTLLDSVLTPHNLAAVATELREACGTWAREQKQRREGIERQIREIEGRRSKLYDLLELHGKDAPNLGDLTQRLRSQNDKIKDLQDQLLRMAEEKQPEVTVTDDDIADLAEIIRTTVKASDNPKKLRQFFSTFVAQIVVHNDEIKIDYLPERLLSLKGGVVPSMGIWRSDRSLPGTKKTIKIPLPQHFKRAA